MVFINSQYMLFFTSCNMLRDDFSVHRTETHRLIAVIALSRLKLISELRLSLQVEDIKLDYFWKMAYSFFTWNYSCNVRLHFSRFLFRRHRANIAASDNFVFTGSTVSVLLFLAALISFVNTIHKTYHRVVKLCKRGGFAALCARVQIA